MGVPNAVKPAGAYRIRPVASRDDALRSGQQVPGQEARLEAALGAWWREDRPAWTEASWWDLTLHEDVRRLLWLIPGHHLVTALAELPPGAPCPVPHDDDRLVSDWPTPGREEGWPCACQIVTAAAWDACASWLATRCASSLIAAAGPNPVSFDIAEGRQRIEDPAREELAHALRSSIPAMGNRIAHARDLTSHPQLLQLVESAAISGWAGRLVLDHVKDLEDDDADRVIEDVASRVQARLASGRRPYHSAEVNRIARAARLRACPDTDQQARVRAFATRRVTVHHTGRGMATLVAELADVDAHRIHRRLTAIAAGLQADTPEDSRTRDQLRADVLTDLLLGPQSAGPTAGMPAGTAAAPTSSTSPGPGPARPAGPAPDDAVRDAGAAGSPPRPEIQVIVTLETLLGLTDDPAEVCGLGPIPADVGRALASDGRWRAWVTDAAGTVTAIGQRGYVPNAALARLVRAREPHCRFPGCRHPAARCDLDHAVPWPHGPTSPANLGPLCRRHHNLKTHTPWTLDPEPSPHDRSPGSGWRWRTPAGLTIVDGPAAPLDMP